MPTLSLITKYRKNTGLILTYEELLAIYFYGVNISSKDGSKIDPSTANMYIGAAQREVERYFDIRIVPKLITETIDYNRDDYTQGFPYIRTSLPVVQVLSLRGLINNVQQIKYPQEWLSANSSTDGTYYRQISIVPNGSTVNPDANVIYTGLPAYYGLMSYRNVPNYWTVQYDTGFRINSVPMDIVNLIGMMASIPLFAIAGDLILGAGIASQSLSIDGLSQSISSTSSATNAGYGARIIEYRKTIKEIVGRLKRHYKGITFAVC
jgi:hypothetical protein